MVLFLRSPLSSCVVSKKLVHCLDYFTVFPRTTPTAKLHGVPAYLLQGIFCRQIHCACLSVSSNSAPYSHEIQHFPPPLQVMIIIVYNITQTAAHLLTKCNAHIHTQCSKGGSVLFEVLGQCFQGTCYTNIFCTRCNNPFLLHSFIIQFIHIHIHGGHKYIHNCTES